MKTEMADRYSPTPYEKNSIKMRDRSPLNDNGHERSNSRSRSRSPRRPAKPVQNKRLYISNMPFDLKWKDVKDLFKEHVGDCYVTLYDRPDGKPSGAGLVEFRELSKAQEAVDKMNRFEVGGRKIIVREETERDRKRHANDIKADSRSGGGRDRGDQMPSGGSSGSIGRLPMNLPPGVTPQLLHSLGITEGPITSQVFVANLDYKCTDHKLREVFSMAGNVTKLECKNDKDGKFRGLAVVAFETPLEALQAISMFNGQMLYDRSMSVKMDKLANDEERKPSLPEGLKGIGSALPLRMGGGGGGGGGGFMSGGSMPSVPSNMPGPGLGGMSGGLGGLGGGNMMMGGSGGNLSGGDYSSGLGGIGPSGGLSNSGSGTGLGFGDLSSFATLAANLQNNPEAFNTLSNMMNSISSGGSGMMGGNNMMSSNRTGGGSMGYGSSNASSGRRSPIGGMMNDTTSVFVRNLPFTYTWQMMKETFRAAGDVQYAEIKKDSENKSRGFGIVRFATPEEARRAVNLFNKTRVNGRELEVRLNNQRSM